jgi:hypothetical protein
MSAAEPASAVRRRRPWVALLLLLALSLAPRLMPLGHGLPRNYVPDTHIVRAALGMAKDRDPIPPVGKYSTYPNLLPYLLLPVFAGEYAAGRLSGRFAGPGEFQAQVLEAPGRMHFLARVLVALLSALAPLCAYALARAAGFRTGAWFAGALMATGLLHIHFSVQERPWGPLVSALLLCATCATRAAAAAPEDPRRRGPWLVASGAAAGLAFAIHQAGLPFALLTALAWLLMPWPWRGSAALSRRLTIGLLALLAFAVVGIGIGHPYLLRYGPTPSEAVAGAELPGGEIDGAIRVGGQGFVPQLRFESVLRLSWALLGYDPLIAVLGLAGLWLAVRRRSLWPALCFLAFWAAVFFTNQNDHVRYILPVVALLCLPAGLLLERGFEKGGAWRAAALLCLLLPLVQAARFVHVLIQPDTRALAERRLAELPAGSRVAIDRYGPLPDLDLASLERLAELRELGSRERHRLELLRAGVASGGLSVLPLEDVYRFDERQRTVELAPNARALDPDPARLLAAEGVTHLLLVDRDPRDGHGPLLVDTAPAEPLASGPHAGQPAPRLAPLALPEGSALWTLDPGRAGAPDEARLPTELSFPLRSLWQLERPGPRLEIYRLR